jgi:hypothetical protein
MTEFFSGRTPLKVGGNNQVKRYCTPFPDGPFRAKQCSLHYICWETEVFRRSGWIAGVLVSDYGIYMVNGIRGTGNKTLINFFIHEIPVVLQRITCRVNLYETMSEMYYSGEFSGSGY